MLGTLSRPLLRALASSWLRRLRSSRLGAGGSSQLRYDARARRASSRWLVPEVP